MSETLQGHIHLSTTLSGLPENAPDLQWVTIDRLETPTVFLSMQRSQTGKLFVHRLANANGIVQLTEFKYAVKVQPDFGYTLAERRAQLKALNGKSAYLVDHFHCEDGLDHGPFIQPVVVLVGEMPHVGPGMPFFIVDIQLTDDTL